MARAPSIQGTEAGKVEGQYTTNPDMMKATHKHRERVSIDEASTTAIVGGPTETSTSHIEDFAHPATRESQQVVWIPYDTLGVGESEAAACRAAGVSVSMEGATMDGKGRVDVDRAPPGEDIGASTF